MVSRSRHEPRRPLGPPADGSDSIPLNLSFGNFEFQDLKRVGQRGGGVRELSSLLRHAKRQTAAHGEMLHSAEGIEKRNADLLATAMRRASGVKVKDDPKRLAKALAKRRNKKRRSAKKWAERIEKLQQSVDNVVEDRAAARRAHSARKEWKSKEKEKKKQKMKQNSQQKPGGRGASSKKAKKGGGPVKGKRNGHAGGKRSGKQK